MVVWYALNSDSIHIAIKTAVFSWRDTVDVCIARDAEGEIF